MPSVVQDWVSENCTLKMQTVLLCALRGCDGKGKEDVTKLAVRKLRSIILKSAEANPDAAFMQRSEHWMHFIHNIDQYPVHFLMHLMYSFEIIGYKHPNHETREIYIAAYYTCTEALHLLPETEYLLDLRLADKEFDENDMVKYRMAAGTV